MAYICSIGLCFSLHPSCFSGMWIQEIECGSGSGSTKNVDFGTGFGSGCGSGSGSRWKFPNLINFKDYFSSLNLNLERFALNSSMSAMIFSFNLLHRSLFSTLSAEKSRVCSTLTWIENEHEFSSFSLSQDPDTHSMRIWIQWCDWMRIHIPADFYIRWFWLKLILDHVKSCRLAQTWRTLTPQRTHLHRKSYLHHQHCKRRRR